MAEPTPIMDAAVLLLNTDPLLRAARDITVAAMRGDFESDPKVRDAATVIVASRTPPDPTTLLHLADELADHARTYRAAIAALGFADVPMERAEHEARRDRALAGMRAAITSGGFNG